MILALQQAYVEGVSTRKVGKITEKLCGTDFSKDQVSRMAQRLDEELRGWRERRLEKGYPYLVIDARYEHVREDGHVVSEGILTVEGINGQGYREMIGVAAAPGEDGESWGEMFRSLIERGLDPSEIVRVTSDDHLGLRDALQRYFPHAAWQRVRPITRAMLEQRSLAGIEPRFTTSCAMCLPLWIWRKRTGESIGGSCIGRTESPRLQSGWKRRSRTV